MPLQNLTANWKVWPTEGGGFSVSCDLEDGSILVAAPFIPTEIAAEYWLAWLKSGVMADIWPDGRSIENFLIDSRTEGGKVGVSISLIWPNGNPSSVGLAWTNCIRRVAGNVVSVEVAIGMHPAYIETKYSHTAARMALAVLFLNSPTLESAYAEIPWPHRKSKLFAASIGMRYTGYLPWSGSWDGLPEALALYAIDRQTVVQGFEAVSVSDSMGEDHGREERLPEELGATTGGDEPHDRTASLGQSEAGATGVGEADGVSPTAN